MSTMRFMEWMIESFYCDTWLLTQVNDIDLSLLLLNYVVAVCYPMYSGEFQATTDEMT